MFCVAITGGIGSGKSSAVHLFKIKGAGIIDADAIARQLVEPNQPAYKAVVDHFSSDILEKNKHINRKKLRELIFKNMHEKKWLESLLHPLIREEIKNQIKNTEAPYAIIDIPLLINPEDFPYLNRILVIDCPEYLQMERIIKRDKITKAEVERIIQTQISREKRNALADDIILNDTHDLTFLDTQIERLHHDYLKNAAIHKTIHT